MVVESKRWGQLEDIRPWDVSPVLFSLLPACHEVSNVPPLYPSATMLTLRTQPKAMKLAVDFHP